MFFKSKFCSKFYFEPNSKFLWHRLLRRTLVLYYIGQLSTANTFNCKTRVKQTKDKHT